MGRAIPPGPPQYCRLAATHLPMRGTLSDVSGTFWAIRKRKTVWASRTEMLTVHFCPPAARQGSHWREW